MDMDVKRDESEKPSILIVEDDPHIIYILNFLLVREGFAVVAAADGNLAVSTIDSIDVPALVLLDVMLPYRDGFEIVRHIRAKPAWADVPVIMLTGKSQERDIVKALEAGANDYIRKPFQPAELVARLRRFLK